MAKKVLMGADHGKASSKTRFGELCLDPDFYAISKLRDPISVDKGAKPWEREQLAQVWHYIEQAVEKRGFYTKFNGDVIVLSFAVQDSKNSQVKSRITCVYAYNWFLHCRIRNFSRSGNQNMFLFDEALLRNRHLVSLFLGYHDMGNLNALKHKRLEHLDASYLKMNALSIDKFPCLRELNLTASTVQILNIQEVHGLQALLAARTQLSQLKTAALPRMHYLDILNTNIRFLDLRNMTELIQLFCPHWVSALDLNNCRHLKVILVPETRIQHLSLKYQKKLTQVSISGPRLRYLDMRVGSSHLLLQTPTGVVKYYKQGALKGRLCDFCSQ